MVLARDVPMPVFTDADVSAFLNIGIGRNFMTFDKISNLRLRQIKMCSSFRMSALRNAKLIFKSPLHLFYRASKIHAIATLLYRFDQC